MSALGLICVAAGRSTRVAGPTPKPFIELAGRPIFAHALARFAHREDLAQIVLVAPGDAVETLRSQQNQWRPGAVRITVVPGGATRTQSVRHGLAALAPEIDVVAIHDAARPLTPPEAIDRAVDLASRHGAAIVGTAVRDTLKQQADQPVIARTVPREGLWQAQTPQVFRRALIERAYASVGPAESATDDAALVEALGEPVRLVEGTAWNFKITFAEDLPVAEVLLRRPAT